MAEPTSRHSAIYRARPGEAAPDGRLFNGVFDRNGQPVADALGRVTQGLTGPALEIGSGTGQHVCNLARHLPALRFTPSDPDAGHRASIAAWTAHHAAPVATPLALDGARNWADWAPVKALGPLALILSMNVIHIAPFEVARGIITGAGRALKPGGILAFYGPFREGGQHTGEGNKTFDTRLRTDNPDWGIRDTEDLAALAQTAGLSGPKITPMPANNRFVVFGKG